jgi:Zn finger protein HypA/HybF involved in hydrogenase expression
MNAKESPTMHEAGLARSIAAALEDAGRLQPGIRVRLLVSGGHDDPDLFDEALRLHLATISPNLDGHVDIVHVPVERTCAACFASFTAINADEPCPRCGGIALPFPTPERIDVELLEPVSAS